MKSCDGDGRERCERRCSREEGTDGTLYGVREGCVVREDRTGHMRVTGIDARGRELRGLGYAMRGFRTDSEGRLMGNLRL